MSLANDRDAALELFLIGGGHVHHRLVNQHEAGVIDPIAAWWVLREREQQFKALFSQPIQVFYSFGTGHGGQERFLNPGKSRRWGHGRASWPLIEPRKCPARSKLRG